MSSSFRERVTSAPKVNFYGRSLIPFTSGIIPFVYAFFWPESFGIWLGTIVHAFRSASGF